MTNESALSERKPPLFSMSLILYYVMHMILCTFKATEIALCASKISYDLRKYHIICYEIFRHKLDIGIAMQWVDYLLGMVHSLTSFWSKYLWYKMYCIF